MARVVAFIPDLLFGSNVLGALQRRRPRGELVEPTLGRRSDDADVLVVDLTADAAERIERVRGARRPRAADAAFYSHVEADVRALAEQAGFDLVVPRSRMAREGVRW